MSLRKLNSLLLVAVALVASVSCKKDSETESLPSLNGSVYFECPAFLAPGTTVTMKASGIEHPDGDPLGYAWKVTPTMTKSDTTDVFVHTFSDTLQTYTVNCYVFAGGYNNSSGSRQVMVVKGGLDGSLSQTGIEAADPKITFDGIDYYYEKIGDLEWFRNNLAAVGSGVPFVNSEVTSDVLGRFYTYEEAMTACPEGWRLPTEEDWMSLAEALGETVTEKYSIFENVTAKLMVNAYFNDIAILEYWPVVGDVTNSSRLGLLPFGYVNLGDMDESGKYPYAAFDGIYTYAAFWTADKVEGNENLAYYRYMISSQTEMMVGEGDVKSFGANVRCVRDAQ